MRILEGVRLATEQMRSQKLKSFFSLLGVIVGVMFLIVVVSIVEGMDRYVRGTFAERLIGMNTVNVLRNPGDEIPASPEQRRAWARAPSLTFDDLEHLRERVTFRAIAGAESTTGGEIESEFGRRVENVRISAVSAETFEIQNLEVERGRPFTRQEADRGAPVVVLGSSTADVLFESIDPLGKRVRIRGFPFQVIGVLAEKGSFLGFSLDNTAVAPTHSPVQRMAGPPDRVGVIQFKAETPEMVVPLQQQIIEIMRVRRQLRPSELNNFAAETVEGVLGFWNQISRILYISLPGLVGTSLVVGGIVIMNIMLVSVMERTREIGVRKALGARRADILMQVLIESGTLSGMGAVIGVGVGVALTVLVGAVSPLPAVVAPQWIILGVSLGVIVGVVSGVYPASRAARLDPVDALRYE